MTVPASAFDRPPGGQGAVKAPPKLGPNLRPPDTVPDDAWTAQHPEPQKPPASSPQPRKEA